MNWQKITFLFILALFSAILDTSFFSAITIFGASIILTYLILIFLAIRATEETFIFAAFSVIFFTIFSSISVIIILLNFLIIPLMVFYLRKRFLPEPSFLASLLYFSAGSLIFELIFILYFKEFGREGLTILGSFIAMSTIAGMIIYVTESRIRKIFHRREIKI